MPDPYPDYTGPIRVGDRFEWQSYARREAEGVRARAWALVEVLKVMWNGEENHILVRDLNRGSETWLDEDDFRSNVDRLPGVPVTAADA